MLSLTIRIIITIVHVILYFILSTQAALEPFGLSFNKRYLYHYTFIELVYIDLTPLATHTIESSSRSREQRDNIDRDILATIHGITIQLSK